MSLNLLNNLDKEKQSSFIEKIKSIIHKQDKELASTLSNNDIYDKIKSEMTKKNIDEHSLQWAEILIKNWLWVYVISTIKDYPSDTHENIADLLILNNDGWLLTWRNNNMVEDLQVDTHEILDKLYYTNQWDCFKNMSCEDPVNNEKRTQKIFLALEYFKDKPEFRDFVINNLKWEEDDILRFIFKWRNFTKFTNMLTPEEQEKYENLINHIKDIL